MPLRVQAGNVNYDSHRSEENPDVWMLYHNRVEPADLSRHFEPCYMKDFASTLRDVLKGETNQQRFS